MNRKTKEAEGQDEADMMPEEEDDEDSELKDIVTAHFIDAGMFETRCTSTDFVVYLSHVSSTKIRVLSVKPDGIVVEWVSNGIPEEALQSFQEVTGLLPSEYGAIRRKQDILVPSPHTLKVDKSLVRVKGYPSVNPQHMVVIVPFVLDTDNDILAEF